MWPRGWSLPRRGACVGPRPAGPPPPLHGAKVMLWVLGCELQLNRDIETLCPALLAAPFHLHGAEVTLCILSCKWKLHWEIVTPGPAQLVSLRFPPTLSTSLIPYMSSERCRGQAWLCWPCPLPVTLQATH